MDENTKGVIKNIEIMDKPDDVNSHKIPVVRRKDLVYPELSYQIVGALYDVYNSLGPGHLEKVYQRAVAEALNQRGLKYEEQVMVPLLFNNKPVGKYFLDFLIEDKVVLELKQGDRFRKTNMNQIKAYLVYTEKKLAILANFTQEGVLFRRLINTKDS